MNDKYAIKLLENMVKSAPTNVKKEALIKAIEAIKTINRPCYVEWRENWLCWGDRDDCPSCDMYVLFEKRRNNV